jgi:hypothetical protein
MTEWKIIKDDNVRHIWEDSSGKEHAIPPSFYAEAGTPVDGDTGDDMEYVRTEILI